MLREFPAKAALSGALGALLIVAALGSAATAAAQERGPAEALQVSAASHDPAAVNGVAARATSSTSVDVTWQAATPEGGVVRYEVRSPALVATVDGTATGTTISGLVPGGWYSIQVWAYDAAGRIGVSDLADLRTPRTDAEALLPDLEAPSAPGAVAVTRSRVTATSAPLVWVRAVDNIGVVEYRVRDRLSGAVIASTPGQVAITKLKSLTVALSPGTTYELEIIAVDAAGNTSVPSKSVRVTTAPAF